MTATIMHSRENLLRAVHFDRPDLIPMSFHINASCWHHYPQDALQELMVQHPLLFPGYQPVERVTPVYGGNSKAGAPYTDSWGCVWETTDDGITGSVVRHPLQNWDASASFTAPDPQTQHGHGPVDWAHMAADFAQARAEGRLVAGSLHHGHTFLTLCDLRGYEGFIMDLVDEDPRAFRLIEMVEAFNQGLVDRYLQLGVEWMGYPEDLGMQVGPMISPDLFRRYIKPSYQRLMAPAREAGCIIHMHSDGDIRSLVDDLIDGGVQVVNLQDQVNGLEWIKDRLAGKYCIDLDIDRQEITRFGTPRQIDDLIRTEVEMLGTPQGGLLMIYGLYPDVPLENVKALMDAMERYAGHWS